MSDEQQIEVLRAEVKRLNVIIGLRDEKISRYQLLLSDMEQTLKKAQVRA